MFTVIGDISVEEDDSLHIMPGTDLLFEGMYNFFVDGYIHADGNVGDIVKFIPYISTNHWGGIDLTQTASNNSILEYCRISGAHSDSSGGGIVIKYCSPTFSNCLITDNSSLNRGGGIYSYQSDYFMEYSVISYNSGKYGGGISLNYS